MNFQYKQKGISIVQTNNLMQFFAVTVTLVYKN